MKLVSTLFVFFALLFTLIGAAHAEIVQPAASPASTQSADVAPPKIDTYTAFWPITAGRVRGDRLYFVKNLKETLRGFFTFGDFKKADYKLTLSEKRVVEAEKLYLQNNDYKNGLVSLEEGTNKRTEAVEHYKKAENLGRYVADMKNRLKDSLAKQRGVVSQIKDSVVATETDSLNTQIEKIKSLESSLSQ